MLGIETKAKTVFFCFQKNNQNITNYQMLRVCLNNVMNTVVLNCNDKKRRREDWGNTILQKILS